MAYQVSSYEIETTDGVRMGVFTAPSVPAAVEAYAVEAGYTCFMELAAALGKSVPEARAELKVTEVFVAALVTCDSENDEGHFMISVHVSNRSGYAETGVCMYLKQRGLRDTVRIAMTRAFGKCVANPKYDVSIDNLRKLAAALPKEFDDRALVPNAYTHVADWAVPFTN